MSLPESINLSKDDGYDKKQNGKSLLARRPRACGPDGVRASRLLETQAGGIAAISSKIGCISQTLRGWGVQAKKDSGTRDGVSTEEWDRIKALEREVRELRQTNEILRKGERVNPIGPREPVNAYFAQAELDRPLKL